VTQPGSPDQPADQLGELVRVAQRGDALAMNDLLDLLAPYVGRLCGPIALQDGPDAAQAALFGWVRAIAVREAVRVARRSQTGRTVTGALADLPAPGDPQLGTDVRSVLARLAPEHRAVLVLRDLEGLDEQAAAAMLKVPRGTVKSRLSRARRSFRKEWQA
jgi:RNA polymerase sigma-70 factor (ECF subfamily)